MIKYGEKLVLLSQAATPIIAVLPPIPPSPSSPYTGRGTTGAVRASLQHALDNYKTGQIHLPPQPAPGELSRSDTQSFGESHASELSSINSEGQTPAPVSPSPINPQVLNQSPAPIPTTPASSGLASAAVVAAVAQADPSASNLPAVTPTIAETGIPVSAGPEGPGPAKGSLYDIKSGSQDAPKQETAEEEKKRLAALYSPPAQSTPPASTPAPTTSSPAVSTSTGQTQIYETAEEEKKRLEREEREKLLQGVAPPDLHGEPKIEEELPPYQEPGL